MTPTAAAELLEGLAGTPWDDEAERLECLVRLEREVFRWLACHPTGRAGYGDMARVGWQAADAVLRLQIHLSEEAA